VHPKRRGGKGPFFTKKEEEKVKGDSLLERRGEKGKEDVWRNPSLIRGGREKKKEKGQIHPILKGKERKFLTN